LGKCTRKFITTGESSANDNAIEENMIKFGIESR
jgi:hypothetical protein